MKGLGKPSRASPPRPRLPKVACWKRPSVEKARSASESATARSKKSAPIRAVPTREALRVRWRSAELEASRVTVAAREVVIDHAGRLHEGVDDRRSAELEAA